MDVNEYQLKAMETAIYPMPIIFPSLGLAGEAGEVADKNYTPCDKYCRHGSYLGQKRNQKEAMPIRAGHIRCDAPFYRCGSHANESEADNG